MLFALMGFILISNIALIMLFKSNPSADIGLLKSLESHITSEDKQMQNIYLELNKINKQLPKELSFRDGLKFVLAAEGGISDDAADTGGLTNLGITHTEYDSYRASKELPLRSVRDISLVEARDIYRHNYWLKSGCSDTPRRVAISCFDWQVNSGRGFSTLQLALGGIAADGIPGHRTFNELSYWLTKPNHEDKLLHKYFAIREADYRRWGVGSQSVFLGGWLRRAQDLKNYLAIP